MVSSFEAINNDMRMCGDGGDTPVNESHHTYTLPPTTPLLLHCNLKHTPVTTIALFVQLSLALLL
eukprot:scaffold114777_cov26-Cyclotella_meneghiniana.AAC.1